MLTVFTLSARRPPSGGRLAARIALCLLATGALSVAPAAAIEVESLYTAQVPLDPNDPDSRNSAYERALNQILVRITGSESAAVNPELRSLFPNPARYVLQYRPGADNTLWVAMDGAAIEKLVRQTGTPVWGSDRPLTLIWLAVDWGQGERQLIGAAGDDDSGPPAAVPGRDERLREQIRAVARERGLPVRFPELDDEDRAAVSFSDVWGGFRDRILDASRRYGANSVLLGRLRPGEFQRNRWSYYFGNEQRQWNGEPEEAMHLLADTLAGELVFSGSGRAASVSLTISGIDSVEAFAAVDGLIGGLSAVDRYALEAVEGDRVRYRVELNGGAERLGSALEFSGVLTRLGSAGSRFRRDGPETLEYTYRP